MAITRLAQSNPSANTETLLHTSTRNAVVSIIATNTSSSAADISMWTVPDGAGSASYVYHAYNSPLPGNNTLESFRFAIEDGDELYVESSTAFVSFSLNGIYETNGTSSITVAALSASPTENIIGDVWVNTDDDTVNFWDGSIWIAAGGAGGSTVAYQSASPSDPEIGTLWIDSDSDTSLLTTDDIALRTPYTSASPSYGITGQLWIDSNTNILYAWTGSAWIALGGIGGEDILTNQSASNIYLPISASSTILSAIVDSAPSTLDTLNELAAALNDDASFATTVTNSIGTKLSISSASATYAPIDSPTFTGIPLSTTPTYDDSSTKIATTEYVKNATSRVTINSKTANYTLAIDDAGEVIEMNNSSARTITIPLNSSVPFPIGTSITLIQTGSGQLSIAATSGVTLNSTPGLKLRTQWSSATLLKRGTDTWIAFGDLTA